MHGLEQIKRQIFYLIKGIPVIVFFFALFVTVGRVYIKYAQPTYQSIAKIKLDDQKFGYSNNALYDDFQMFSLEHRIEAEAELLGSPLIVASAIDQTNLTTEVYREGSIKRTLLFGNCPFSVITDEENIKPLYFKMSISDSGTIKVHYGTRKINARMDEPFVLNGIGICIVSNTSAETIRYQLKGDYSVKLTNKEELTDEIIGRLSVKAMDKETPILRIVFKDENPERSAFVVNAVCQAYIQDYVESKSSTALETVKFIDEQLDEISEKLKISEMNLQQFKDTNNVVNTRQETETGLREISQLHVKMVDLEVNERAIRDLQQYMQEGVFFDNRSVNFGFGDLVLTEMVKKIKLLNEERIDLSNKYTEESRQIKSIDIKIAEAKEYIHEAIVRNLKDIQIRKQEIRDAYNIQSGMFETLPERERRQHTFERDFMINESVYNFLSQKKIDADILANSVIAFHRIIQPPKVHKTPVAPNKTLITFLSGLMGLITGMGLWLLRKKIRSRLVHREDIEEYSSLPFLGAIRKKPGKKDFDILFKSLQLKQHLDRKEIISVCTVDGEEGSDKITKLLVEGIRGKGLKCAHIRVKGEEGTCSSGVEDDFLILNNFNLEDQILKLAMEYDYTICTVPPIAADIVAVDFIRMSQLSMFVFTSNVSKVRTLVEAEGFVSEYNLNRVCTLLADVQNSTNYRGKTVQRSQFKEILKAWRYRFRRLIQFRKRQLR